MSKTIAKEEYAPDVSRRHYVRVGTVTAANNSSGYQEIGDVIPMPQGATARLKVDVFARGVSDVEGYAQSWGGTLNITAMTSTAVGITTPNCSINEIDLVADGESVGQQATLDGAVWAKLDVVAGGFQVQVKDDAAADFRDTIFVVDVRVTMLSGQTGIFEPLA